MNQIILIGYEAATSLLPFLIVFLVFHNIYKKKRMQRSIIQNLFVFAFAVYIAGVFYFTGVPTLYSLFPFRPELKLEQINLIPFIRGINVTTCLLNILLFIPLGFLIPLIWRSLNKWGALMFISLLFSLFIEISQLFTFRQTDVDDLILNTLGGVLGFLIFRLISGLFRMEGVKNKYYKCEPLLYILVMFCGYFFLYNGMGLARLLYGF